MDKRYQVFVSSTYADLEAERRAVIQTVIELDCIPAGMELFPAVDEEQFEFIKRVIEDCDYYLVIIGGRYGTTTADGVSFTEKEYDYAVERGLKVIALVRRPDDVPSGKCEEEPDLRERLERFREKVATGRLVKFWTASTDLPGLVALSLSKTIKMFPATGWVRGSVPASEDILGEVNDLRKENEGLRRQLASVQSAARPRIADIAGLDDTFTVTGSCTYYASSYSSSRTWSAEVTWRDIFAAIAPYLYDPNDIRVKETLAKAMFERSRTGGSSPLLDDQVFKTISVQLRTLGLVNTEYMKTAQGGMALFWSLTPNGEAQMLETRVVRKKSVESAGVDGDAAQQGVRAASQ